MRITAGTHKGHKLLPVASGLIRPTSDKVRLAIFNSILTYGLPENAHVLDLFSGTGALGLEAISRGARTCDFVDSSARSIELCKNNAQKLKLDMSNFTFNKKNCLTFLETVTKKEAHYDLVFVDPPYNKNLVQPTLSLLDESGVLNADAICVVESEMEIEMPSLINLKELSSKIYGDTRIGYYLFKSK
jgi:16S rRNA (guanine(966)-N(2))-methyltransferase RsmD